MKTVLALGNPGTKFDGTRHNVGFFTLDSFAAEHGATFNEKPKLKAYVAEFSINGEKVILAKPNTFYNNVGESYRAITDFYKLEPENTLIVHDELALPFGTIRARIGGSDAGNNGIKSINQHGGERSSRIRIGIGNAQRQVMGDTDFVLGKFSKEESEVLYKQLPTVSAVTIDFLNGTFKSVTYIDQKSE